ncbi:MAG: Wzz/FepE/Etk N-terminal domain-containing protein [Anaerolineae bacterium]|nr:Wzz/FepE/Etk N-terminal domain-containing protein [Anaerolineae bacterium]
MSDELELDLRPYIVLLVQKWYVIAIAGLVAGICGFAIASFLPPSYEATAYVAITNPSYIMDFDSLIQTVNSGRPLSKAYPDFALSADTARQVYERLDPKPEGIRTPGDLLKRLQASLGDDYSLLSLTVSMNSPEDAARVANLWAEIFIKNATRIYGNQDDRSATFFATQLADNKAEMDAAENALQEFEARNDLSILNNQLSIANETHVKYLRMLKEIDLIIQDLQGLRDNLGKRNQNAPADLTDQLSILSLQTKALGTGEGLPVFLELKEDTALTANQTIGDQVKVLDDLIVMLQNKMATIDSELSELLPEMEALRSEIMVLSLEQTHLNRTLSIKRDMDTSLSKKLEEATLASQDESGEFQSAGVALPPEEDSGPSRLMFTAVSGLVAASLAIAILVFRLFWQTTWVEMQAEVAQTNPKQLLASNGSETKVKEQLKEVVETADSLR